MKKEKFMTRLLPLVEDLWVPSLAAAIVAGVVIAWRIGFVWGVA